MRLISLVFLVLAMLVGCEKPNEFVPPAPPTVSVATPIEREVTEYVEFTGRTDATETVEIRARVKGFLETVDFIPGQYVEAGDLLFTIEREPFEAALDSARAQVARSQAAVELATTTCERFRQAFKMGAATELEVAEAEAQEKQAHANLQITEAAVVDAEINLSYTRITSPIKGRMSRELVDAGNLVGAGESTLLTIVVQDEPLFVYFTVNERELLLYLEQRPAPGGEDTASKDEVQLRLADGRLYGRTGTIDFADNQVDPVTGTLQVRAIFPNPDGILFPGLFARLRAPIETKIAMLVPDIAIQRDIQGHFVYVVNAENTVERRNVERGALHGRLRVVKTGLETDERVVVVGIQRARDGVKVQPELVEIDDTMTPETIETQLNDNPDEAPPNNGEDETPDNDGEDD